jgi:hypothetical protein
MRRSWAARKGGVWRWASALVALFVCHPHALGQLTYDWKLRGITQAVFLLEYFGENEKRCGLREGEVLNAVKLPLRAYTKVTEAALGSSAPTIYLRLTTVRAVGLCSHAIDLSLHQSTEVSLPQNPGRMTHKIVLWHQSVLLISNETAAPERVVRAVEDLGRMLAVAWQNGNPP